MCEGAAHQSASIIHRTFTIFSIFPFLNDEVWQHADGLSESSRRESLQLLAHASLILLMRHTITSSHWSVFWELVALYHLPLLPLCSSALWYNSFFICFPSSFLIFLAFSAVLSRDTNRSLNIIQYFEYVESIMEWLV